MLVLWIIAAHLAGDYVVNGEDYGAWLGARNAAIAGRCG